LEPDGGSTKSPVVLIPGGVHTGTCYLTTPDGRTGWAYVFARSGYKAVVPDYAGLGRSGYVPIEEITSELVIKGLGKVIQTMDQPVILVLHSLSGFLGWKLLEEYGDRIEKIIAVAPSPPGNMVRELNVTKSTGDKAEVRYSPGGPIMNITLNEQFVPEPQWAQRALISATGLFPQDRVPGYVASLIPFPPKLILERLNYEGCAPRIADFTHYKNKRVLVAVGTHDSNHPPHVDALVADWLNENGAQADFVELGTRGIVGNSHMLMLEFNSDQIAEGLISWIEKGEFPSAE
jgi:pimeloyl-ACP methyl ester carboxylesterase